MDSTLDPELLARLQKYREQEKAKQQPKVKPVPKSRAHVNVPKPSGPKMSDDERSMRIAEWKLARCGSKKKEAVIALERAEAEPIEPPTYSRPAITDDDKLKLQQVMEFGKAIEPRVASTAADYEDRPRRNLDQERFDELIGELADRKQFLKELQGERLADGKAMLCANYDKNERRLLEQKILSEIQERVDEMKILDKRLRCGSASA